ncbi:MAG: hypothetical protein KKE23_03665, partial [Nanoarchaeota archaeon]|nr:hypothetical protein [Nanoarchaeota archaeon]
KGYLPRPTFKLNKHRFHTTSYSPFVALIAERLTEAVVATSFSGQPIIVCIIYPFKYFRALKSDKSKNKDRIY